MREGLEIAQEMSPFLSSRANKQVNNAISKLHKIDQIQNSIVRIQTAETMENKAEYILDNLKLFLPGDRFKKISQIVNIAKLVENTAQIMKTDDSPSDDMEITDQDQDQDRGQDKSLETSGNRNEQLADIVDLIDKFGSKKTE